MTPPKTLFVLSLLTTGALLVGCAQEDAPSPSAAVDGAKFLLAEEPDGAMGVIAASESAEDGAPLVLVGRVGGSANPWIKGRAAFTLLDPSIAVVSEAEAAESDSDTKICTGDCCATERKGCTTLVKVVDAQGELVRVDARELLGLKESDMVVVRGKAERDDAGNFFVLADGVHVR